MVRRGTIVCVSILMAAAGFAGDAGDGYLSPEERQELLELMDSARTKLFGLIEGVSEEQWTFKPAPDRWSVGECAEHIVRSNESLFATAKRALATEPDADWQTKTAGKTELLNRVMPNRNPGGAGGASAPQEIRPREGWSRAKAMAEFNRVHDEVAALIRDTELPVKQHIQTHPFPVFGDLNAYHWLIYVPLHTIRHSRQIIEVQETEGYPR